MLRGRGRAAVQADVGVGFCAAGRGEATEGVVVARLGGRGSILPGDAHACLPRTCRGVRKIPAGHKVPPSLGQACRRNAALAKPHVSCLGGVRKSNQVAVTT